MTATTVKVSNAVMNMAPPEFKDVIQNNPQLFKEFKNTVKSMIIEKPHEVPPTNTSFFGDRPEPPQQRPPRPDIREARGGHSPPREGVDLQDFSSWEDALPPSRPQMRGPSSEYDKLLTGLKPMESIMNHPPPPPASVVSAMNGNDSIVSSASVRDMQNTQLPKPRRRNKSDKNLNVVSIDL
jgi:hypothetical protein